MAVADAAYLGTIVACDVIVWTVVFRRLRPRVIVTAWDRVDRNIAIAAANVGVITVHVVAITINVVMLALRHG